MAGEQDIVSLGLNIDSFNSQKAKVLREYIDLFNQLSKYDGKVFNPVMGDGLTKFTSSISSANDMIDKMNAKIVQLSNSFTANKIGLSETSKALLDNSTAIQKQIESTIVASKKSEEYRVEQQRVVDTLKSLAKEQAENQKRDASDSKAKATQAARAYREEQQRVVSVLRQLATQQDNESKLTKNLISDYDRLKQTLKQQAAEYQRLYLERGKHDVQTKAALRDYSNTASVVNSIDKKLSDAGGGAAGFSRGLGTAFGYLRNIAYILPGIGIAGIFNLAFEAIGNVIDSLGVFNNKELELLKTQTELTKSFNEQTKALNALYEERDRFFRDYVGTPYGGTNTLTDIQKDIDEKISRGYNRRTILNANVSASERRLKDARDKLLVYADPRNEGSAIPADLNKLKNEITQLSFDAGFIINEINQLSNRIANKTTKEIGLTADAAKQKVELDQAKLSGVSERKKNLEAILKEYVDSEHALSIAKLSLKKFEDDQARMLATESAKTEANINIEKNKSILENDRNFHDKRHNAIISNYQQDIKIAAAVRDNVLKDLSKDNEDKAIANKKYAEDILKAELKRDSAIDKNDVEFYQRKILALTEISKDEISIDAIKNERIFLNEQKSLDERLDAYENYIIQKQKTKDLEESLALQKGAAKEGGENSLTPEEELRVKQHSKTEKYNIQADAEKRNYQIVDSYLKDKEKTVKSLNDKEVDIDKSAYAKELHALNDRFKNKIFAYEGFKKSKEQIDKKYGLILSEQQEIDESKKKVERLKSVYNEILELKVKSDRDFAAAKDAYSKDGSMTNERILNQEIGKRNAIEDHLAKAKYDVEYAEKNGDDILLKQAQARYEKLIQFEKEYAQNRKEIMNELWNFAGTLINRNVEDEINAIREKSKAYGESIDAQKDAVEKSSLSEKDKAALDIQLSQQKLEESKRAILEERKLKHDAAVRDKELAIARVTFETIEAQMSALKIAPPAGEALFIQRGILGAIKLATLIATKIPEYSEGTDNHPGGLARTGEDGIEIIKEPGKDPYIVLKDNISYLPKGTEVIPMKDDYPVFGEKNDDSWQQFKWLGKQIVKSNKKEIRNIFKPTIVINSSFEQRKRDILGN